MPATARFTLRLVGPSLKFTTSPLKNLSAPLLGLSQLLVPLLPRSQLPLVAPVQRRFRAPPVTFSLIWLAVARFRLTVEGREFGRVGSGLRVTVPAEKSRLAAVRTV